jgi:hypothetical protein
MKSVRKRLTYANVMSSIAVFLVLGGATAFAASTLGKNTVGSKQLKKNAVTAAKIKNGSVTGAKLKLSSIGKVPSASTADSATTANSAKTAETAKTAESAKTAGTANSAKSADTANSANTANTANTAGNANTVGGNTVRKVFYAVDEQAEPTQILSLDGLTITASCVAGELEVIATTSVDSLIHSGGSYGEAWYNENDNFQVGEEFEVFAPGTTGNDSVIGNLVYVRPDGTVVSATLASEEEGFSGFETDCIVAGHATAG